jgi:hypothetical protein
VCPGWKHALVKDSTDEHTIPLRSIKDDVASLLDASKAAMDRVASPSQIRHLRNVFKAGNEVREIGKSLSLTPSVRRVVENFDEVRFSVI